MSLPSPVSWTSVAPRSLHKTAARLQTDGVNKPQTTSSDASRFRPARVAKRGKPGRPKTAALRNMSAFCRQPRADTSSQVHAATAASPGGFQAALLHCRQIKAGAFFGAAHKQVAVAQRGRAPALAGDRLEAGDFFIGVRDSLHHHELAVIRQGQKVFAGQDDLARSKARLLPFDGTGLQVHAFQGAGAEAFKADHAV